MKMKAAMITRPAAASLSWRRRSRNFRNRIRSNVARSRSAVARRLASETIVARVSRLPDAWIEVQVQDVRDGICDDDAQGGHEEHAGQERKISNPSGVPRELTETRNVEHFLDHDRAAYDPAEVEGHAVRTGSRAFGIACFRSCCFWVSPLAI